MIRWGGPATGKAKFIKQLMAAQTGSCSSPVHIISEALNF
jgi:hypothetical protein